MAFQGTGTPGEEKPDLKTERAFQLDVLRVQMSQWYRVAYYAAYFGVGASFEVFSLTLPLTALLLARTVDPVWWARIAPYLVTGVEFVAYGVYGFGRTRRSQEAEPAGLAGKYLSAGASMAPRPFVMRCRQAG